MSGREVHIPRLRRTPKFIRVKDRRMASQQEACSHENCNHVHHEDRVSGPDEDPTDETIVMPPVPPLFTKLPPIKDSLETLTSHAQDATIEEVLPFLTLSTIEEPEELNSHGITKLRRDRHVRFLRRMEQDHPAPFVAADSVRPWYVYWSMTGLSLLGQDISPLKDRLISTFTACQSPAGGFGAGPGYYGHLATSYAAVLSLVTDGDAQTLDLIDRKALWRWLGFMKQPDGSFSVCEGGEVDIRGAYCAMTIISLLNLPLELPQDAPARAHGHTTLISGLGEWISSTQTYEGGIASRPHNEAHGGYAFCALACLSILGPPKDIIPKYLDIQALIRWMSARQYAPEGGLSGRTNKLVDACYSHWVGGCWSIIDAALGLVETDLWSREGLARYILCVAQHPKGGIRDKPSKPPDSYHTCYSLTGLAACEAVATWDASAAEHVAGNELTAAYGWRIAGTKEGIWDEGDCVVPMHPIFVVPVDKAIKCREFFENRESF